MLSKERNRIWRTLGIVSLVAGAALVLSAWMWQTSGDAESRARAEEDPVKVTVAEDSLQLSPASVDAGTVTFEVTNEGSEPHSFAIFGPVERRIEGEIAAGETKSLEANLNLGTYTAYCPIEGHRDQESVEFTVGE